MSPTWVDGPFRLLAKPTADIESHACIRVAAGMINVHNTIIRGLNAILLQAPHVPSSDQPGYNANDVRDLLFFIKSWTKMVHHHHWVEETFIFPEIDKLAGREGYMEGPRHEHELFHSGMEALERYAGETGAAEYRWAELERILGTFTTALTDHLYAEIEVFYGMTELDGEALWATWQAAEARAKQNGNLAMLYDIFPVVLGCADKTFPGGEDFPPLPAVMRYAVKYWFGAGQGAWRFLPCDWWGKPRELAFGPKRASN